MAFDIVVDTAKLLLVLLQVGIILLLHGQHLLQRRGIAERLREGIVHLIERVEHTRGKEQQRRRDEVVCKPYRAHKLAGIYLRIEIILLQDKEEDEKRDEKRRYHHRDELIAHHLAVAVDHQREQHHHDCQHQLRDITRAVIDGDCVKRQPARRPRRNEGIERGRIVQRDAHEGYAEPGAV